MWRSTNSCCNCNCDHLCHDIDSDSAANTASPKTGTGKRSLGDAGYVSFIDLCATLYSCRDVFSDAKTSTSEQLRNTIQSRP